MTYKLGDSLPVGKYTAKVVIARQGLISGAALGDLTGGSIRKRITDAIGKTQEIWPWKRFRIDGFRYSPVFVGGLTTGDEVWEIDFTQLENPVPVVAILGGIGVLAGLTIIYLISIEINDFAENSPTLAAGLGVSLLLIFLVPLGIWAYFKSSS